MERPQLCQFFALRLPLRSRGRVVDCQLQRIAPCASGRVATISGQPVPARALHSYLFWVVSPLILIPCRAHATAVLHLERQ